MGTVLSGKLQAILLTAAGFLLNLDWSSLASAFGDVAIGFCDGITRALSAADWQQIGRNVALFLKNVEWSGISDALFRGIDAALAGLGDFIRGLIEEAWNNIVDWWHDVAYEDGSFTIEGLLNGIKDTWKSVTDFVSDALDSFVELLSNAWKEAKDLTSRTWTSIKDSLLRTWDSIKSKVIEKAQAIKDKTVSIFNSIKEKIQTAVSAAKENVIAKFQEIKSGIEEKITAAKEKAAEAFESIRTTIQDKLTAAKAVVTNIFDGIKQSIQDKIDGARQKVKDTIDKIKSYFNFQWSLPHLKTPHLSWGTTPASGWVSDILSALGLPTSLPKLSVSWYAKGGIVDGATLIGAGEAGKEAIIPLERNTQWIDNVAGRIAQLLGGGALSRELTEIARRLGEIPAALDRLGLAMGSIPMPVMASGTVIPPRALYVDGPVQGLGDMASQLKQLLTGGAGADGREANYTFIARMNGRTIFREVIAEGKLEKSRTGHNPFALGG